MKNLFFLSFAMILVALSSCTKETLSNEETFNEEYTLRLVEEYNQQLVQTQSTSHKGFMTEGELEAGILQDEHGQAFLAITFKEYNQDGQILDAKIFNFGIDQDFQFPQEMANAQLIFLGNQLIIRNLDNAEQFNLFVQDTAEAVNKIASIKSIDGIYLAIEHSNEVDNLGLSKCSCSCILCPVGQSCGSAECSCTCGGDGCSVSCRNHYNATCMSSCGNQ